MPAFGAASLLRLRGCDDRLIRLFTEVIKHYDCTILEGSRTIEQQRANVLSGVSQTMDSKHLTSPEHPKSRAVDVAPYPVAWPDSRLPTYAKDLGRWYRFIGYVEGIAQSMGIRIRSGADWDMDGDIRNNRFDDLPHWEVP